MGVERQQRCAVETTNETQGAPPTDSQGAPSPDEAGHADPDLMATDLGAWSGRSGPLADLVVLDLTVARAGPTAVRYLADWGARVIRVEAKDPTLAMLGDHNSSDYVNLHRSKWLMQLDLRDEIDRAEFYRLVDAADIVVENFRVGVTHRLGVDYDTLAAKNPKIIYGSISGYGQDGPYADRGAVDQIIQGMGGLMSVTGEPGQGPMRAGIAVSDLAAGHQLAFGIMIALRERERHGHGQWVQVSLLEAMLSFLDFQAARWTVDQQVPAQEGNHHPMAVPMGLFSAADGFLNLSASTDRQWQHLCQTIGVPALAEEERFGSARLRFQHRGELVDRLNAVMLTKTRAEWIQILTDAAIPCGAVLAVDEVFADPQVEHLEMLVTVDHPTRGPVSILRNSITLSRTPQPTVFPSPVPGSDPAEIRRHLGLGQ